MRGKAGNVALDKEEFCNDGLKEFLESFPVYASNPLARSSIKQILKLVFTEAVDLNKLSPYSELGKLQNTISQMGYETKHVVEDASAKQLDLLGNIGGKVNDLANAVSFLSESIGRNLPIEDCTGEI